MILGGLADIVVTTLRNRRARYANVSDEKLERMKRRIIAKVAPLWAAGSITKEHAIDLLACAVAEQERSIFMVVHNYDPCETANLGEW